MKARSASIMSAALRPVQQFMVGEDERHHRFDHRRATDADTGVVAALGDDVGRLARLVHRRNGGQDRTRRLERDAHDDGLPRSEEHTSELQSLMRISYAVFCLKKKKKHNDINI